MQASRGLIENANASIGDGHDASGTIVDPADQQVVARGTLQRCRCCHRRIRQDRHRSYESGSAPRCAL